jgi:hypothetical protein
VDDKRASEASIVRPLSLLLFFLFFFSFCLVVLLLLATRTGKNEKRSGSDDSLSAVRFFNIVHAVHSQAVGSLVGMSSTHFSPRNKIFFDFIRFQTIHQQKEIAQCQWENLLVVPFFSQLK